MSRPMPDYIPEEFITGSHAWMVPRFPHKDDCTCVVCWLNEKPKPEDTICALRELIQRLEHPWTPAEASRPDQDRAVLFHSPLFEISVMKGTYRGVSFIEDGEHYPTEGVTHWMYVPTSPSRKEQS